jgi:hypothetical protein
MMRKSAFRVRNVGYIGFENILASVVLSAEPGRWPQAGRFAAKVLGGAELKSFADLRWRSPVDPILVYLARPDYGHLRSSANLEARKPRCGDLLRDSRCTYGAARLGNLVGEMRPNHTGVVFDSKAAAASVWACAIIR